MILVINRALGLLNGGGEIFDISVMQHILRKIDDIEIYSGGLKGIDELVKDHNIKVTKIKTPFLRSWAYRFKSNSKMAALLYTLDNLIFELVVILRILMRKKKFGRELKMVYCCSLFVIPFCLSKFFPNVHFVSWLPGPPGKYALSLIKLLSVRSNFHLFTHGYPEEVLISEGLRKDRDFFLLPPGVSNDFANSTMPREIDTNCVRGLTVARLVPIKDIEFLIKCLFYCKQKGLKFHWVIVGEGPLFQRIQFMIEAFGLTKEIDLVGHKKHAEIQDLLCTTDIFALSSEFENYSLAVIEAFANGVPCLLRNVGYLPKLVDNDTRGANFESTDEFYQAIKNFLDNPKIYKKISLSCLHFAAQHTWSSNEEVFHEHVLIENN